MQVPAAAARQKFTASSPKIRSSRPPAREVLHLPTACLWCMEQRPSEDEQRQGRLQGL